jgi:hypothetical protein
MGGVACDDEPAPGADMLGGHWVGEAEAMFAPESLSVGITTDNGEFLLSDVLVYQGIPE